MTDEQRKAADALEQSFIDAWSNLTDNHCPDCGQLYGACDSDETGVCNTSEHTNMKRGGDAIGYSVDGRAGYADNTYKY